jgi:hypothetical protein
MAPKPNETAPRKRGSQELSEDGTLAGFSNLEELMKVIQGVYR